MKLTLYIDGKEAALSSGSDEALILWTYTRDDAEAPAAVKNSYTKTITLPACDANDRIFSHAGTLDRVTASGMFDALRRTPFIIYADDGRVLDRGYLKLDQISRRGEVVLSYDVTLYGGLGGFFYALTYKADGSKMSLADIRWLTTSNQPTTSDLEDARQISVPTLQHGWADLCDGSHFTNESGIVNYVPANNGIPDGDFDAGKAYCKNVSNTPSIDNLAGITTQVTDGGITYTPHPDANGGVILDLGNKFTEWETQCFVPYLQRRAWNVARFLLSIEAGSTAGDFGDWKFRLDYQDDFFDEQAQNPYFWKTWVTLGETDEWNQGLDTNLKGTKTPADYLLGFAKMFGLVFLVDETTQTITLTSRNVYYSGGYGSGVIDLSDRVDTHGEPAEVKPFLATARMYDFAAPTSGAFASLYASKYGRTYGDFLLDSGFPFDASTIDVMGSAPFKGVADVLESSPWYFIKPGEATSAPMDNYVKFVEYGVVTYLLYNTYQGKSLKVSVPPFNSGRVPYNNTNYNGVGALPQFHDADGRRINAQDVLLFLNGKITLPTASVSIPARWHIGSYGPNNLTGGKNVWNISPTSGVTQVTEIPHFWRWHDYGQDYMTLDFGEPKEIANGEDIPQQFAIVYDQFWKRYMEDRFDRDTMVLTARVDLAGLPAGPSLLRRFFYYRGSLWSLNRITDYNPARPGLTRCEFVRVKDITNYTAGQNIPSA